MENISFSKENLWNRKNNKMVEICIDGMRLYACMNPIYNEETQSFSFLNVCIGEKKCISGKIKRISDLTKYEEEQGVIALYYDGEVQINKLLLLREKGVLYLVGTHKFLCNLYGSYNIPILLWDEYHEIACMVNESKSSDIEITIDLTMFEHMYVNEQVRIFFDKGLNNIQLLERINTSLEEILSLSPCFKVKRFDVYYFESIEQLHVFTGMRTTFAYKDKMVFLTYSDLHNNTEIHEILHILLYEMGDPPFLLREGLPSLGYELCKQKRKYSRYVCNVFMRNKFLEKLPYREIDQLIGQVASDRQYSGEDYYTASSFLLWIIYEKGFDIVLDCYKLLKKENSSKQNQQILQNVVGEKFDSMVLKWKESVMLQ